MPRPVGESESLAVVERIARRAHALAIKMIWDANHRDDVNPGDPKVGGHPASCASSLHVLAALHLVVRGPQDVLAIKPHAAPVDHALGFLMRSLHAVPLGRRWLDDAEAAGAMGRLRRFPSRPDEPVFQSYHAESDPDGHFFLPTGSVGIPPVVSAYHALAHRFAAARGLIEAGKRAHWWSLIGDSELREGSLGEAMPDLAERELGEVTWIVDYNRQNLDGIRTPNPRGLGGSDAERIVRTFEANGWRVRDLRHGRLRRALFARPRGEALRQVLEGGFSDFAFQALLRAGDGARVREELLSRDAGLSALLRPLDDGEVQAMFADLGGHDLEGLVAALRWATEPSHAPSLILAHTVKGWGLDCAAHAGNHSALPSGEEVEALLRAVDLDPAAPFRHFEPGSAEGRLLAERGALVRGGAEARWAESDRRRDALAARLEAAGGLPDTLGIDLKLLPTVHTQYVWGQVAAKLIRLGQVGPEAEGLSPEERRWAIAAERLVTMAPDVGTSTQLAAAMNDRVFGPETEPDWEQSYGVADRARPRLAPTEDARSRHLRFEIAEANAMCAVGAFGKLGHHLGLPLLPVMSVYDFFIKRALDQLYYDLYWRSGFVVVGTPSGVTLAPEGAQHSWKSDLQLPELVTWEPAFGVEVDWIFADTFRRLLTGELEGRHGTIVRCVTRALEQAELGRRLAAQPRLAALSPAERLERTRLDALRGGYRLVDHRGAEGYEPGENVVSIFVMGALVTEALAASDRLLGQGLYADVFVVTSADLLLGHLAEADSYAHLRGGLELDGDLRLRATAIDDRAGLVTLAGRRVPAVTVVDGEPGLLDNLGSVLGVRSIALGTRKPSKCGRPADTYGYLGLDAAAIVAACGRALAETAVEEVRIPARLAAELAGRALPTAAERAADAASLWPDPS
jgi:pyruvate dehydrogenase E1 component